MTELAKVTLHNEMDLVLAHKRSMKLAELSGLSLAAQTTFATAVSEVSRNAIENQTGGRLVLGLSNPVRDEYYIVASIEDAQPWNRNAGFDLAKRLVHHVEASDTETGSIIRLHYYIPGSKKIKQRLLEEWKQQFSDEIFLSPYEEIKRKNEQLQLLAERLQESEAQYKTLTNALPLMIFSVKENGAFIYSNDWLNNYTGYSLDMLNEGRWKDSIHADDYALFEKLIYNKQSNGRGNNQIQCRIKSGATGDYMWHLVSVSPLLDENGFVRFRIGFMADIHAQKIYEQTLQDNEALKQTQKLLKENERELQRNIIELNRSNNELQQFAYVASHDLQEPVRKIIFYGDYILQKNAGGLDKKSETYLQSMTTASHRMRNLINDLLSFSRVSQSGAIKISTVSLERIVQEALQDLELLIKDKQARITVSQLPQIEGDPLLLRQLIENLVSNALKYGKENEPVVLEISHENNEEKLIIHFRDEGIGFDEKYVEKIFDLFQRLHSREQYEGTGLGLAICRKIADVHHGRISAKSKPDAGSTFTIELPMKQTMAER